MSVLLEEPPAAPSQPQRREPARLVLAATLIALVLAAMAVVVWRHWFERPAYPPQAVSATVSADVMTSTEAQAALDQLAGRGRLNAPLVQSVTRRLVVGQLSFTVPPNASPQDSYGLFVIDNRLNKPVSSMWGVGPRNTHVSQGWDSSYNRVAEKYPWLSSLAPVKVPDGWQDPGTAVSFRATTGSPVTFVALLDSNALPVTNLSSDITIALVYLGHNGSMWAQRLPVS